MLRPFSVWYLKNIFNLLFYQHFEMRVSIMFCSERLIFSPIFCIQGLVEWRIRVWAVDWDLSFLRIYCCSSAVFYLESEVWTLWKQECKGWFGCSHIIIIQFFVHLQCFIIISKNLEIISKYNVNLSWKKKKHYACGKYYLEST